MAAPHPDDLAAVRVAIQQEDDYRALRRSRWRWRIVALLAVIAIAAFFAMRSFVPPGPYIARHTITGVIVDDPARTAMLRKLADKEDATALILRIDSPGGTTTGAEALFDSLRHVAETKPVVAVMGEVAASGGYIAALAADHIIARGNTITGSIGVIYQSPNAAELLDKVGVEMIEIRSDPLKAAPSPFQPVDDTLLAAQRALVADAYDWFVGLVEERRGLSGADARAAGDGRIFTGRLALDAGLIDAIGGQPEALEWLGEKGIDTALSIREVSVPEEDDSLAGTFLRAAGVDLPSLSRGALSPALMAVMY